MGSFFQFLWGMREEKDQVQSHEICDYLSDGGSKVSSQGQNLSFLRHWLVGEIMAWNFEGKIGKYFRYLAA